MKKSFYLILCSVLVLFSSCGKKQELKSINIKPIVIETDEVKFEVNPRSELLMIAARMANINAFSSQNDNQYVSTVDKMYKPFEKHPLVKQLSKAGKNFQGDASYVLYLANFISEDMTSLSVDKDSMPEYLKHFWKKVNLNKFISNYNDFAVKGNFEKIWMLYELQLKGKLSTVKTFYDKKPCVVEFVRENMDEDVEIIIHTTPIIDNWIIPLPVYTENGKKVLEVYQSPYGDAVYEADDVFVVRYLIEGICYGLVVDNWDRISGKSKEMVNKILEENKISSKKIKDPSYMLSIEQTLALTILTKYLYEEKTAELAEDFDKQFKKYQLFQDFSKIEVEFEKYLNNRDTYPTFAKFFTESFIDTFNKEF